MLLYGSKGAGKSTAAAQMGAVATAAGLRTCTVLTEQTAEDYRGFLRSLGLSGNAPRLIEASDPESLLPPTDCDLLVIDSIHGPGMLRPKAYRHLHRVIDLCRRRDMASVLVSHATKAGTAVGSSAIQHYVDAVVRLRQAGGHYLLEVEKKRRLGSWASEQLRARSASHPHSERVLPLAPCRANGFHRGRLCQRTPHDCAGARLAASAAAGVPIHPRRACAADSLHVAACLGVATDPALIGISVLLAGKTPYEETLDLSLAVAIAASYLHRQVPHDTAFIGGVDLGGIIEPVGESASPVGVAVSQAMPARVFVSSASAGLISESVPKSVEVIGVSSITDCLARLKS